MKTDGLSLMESEIRTMREKLETLNSQIRELIGERDQRNEKFSEFIKEAKENKELRNEINSKIRDEIESKKKALERIRELNQKMGELKKQKEEIYANLEKNKVRPRNPATLKKEIEGLEWKLETTVLPLETEKKLVESIRQKRKLLEPSQGVDTIKKEMKRIFDEKAREKESLTDYNKRIDEVREESGKYHERMLYAYKRASEIKKEADIYHKQFVARKEERDNLYKEYRELIDRKHEMTAKLKEDKIRKQVEDRRKRDELMRMKAEKIFEEFKKGKRLSTEEFRILQEGDLSDR